jgi:hypothetical protein
VRTESFQIQSFIDGRFVEAIDGRTEPHSNVSACSIRDTIAAATETLRSLSNLEAGSSKLPI